MNVAEAALERVLFEDRGRAGGMVGRVDDTQRLVDREGRGSRISIRCSRVSRPALSTPAVIFSSDWYRKARAERSRASDCATCDCTTLLSRKVDLPRNGTLSRASSINASSALRATPIATPANPEAYSCRLL